MRTRIALATAVAVTLISVVLLVTVFSGSPSASVPAAARHEAIGQYRATHALERMSNSQAEKTAQLAAFYQAINNQQEAAWLQTAYDSQLAAFYQAINNQQEAAWLTAVHDNNLADWYQAVNNSEQQAAAQQAAAQQAAAPAPSPSPAPAPASSGGGGWSGPWACIAQYESGGNPSTDTGNGFYGGLQFTQSTWDAYGGSGNPADASIGEQEAVANNVLAAQGWGAWPNTSQECGL